MADIFFGALHYCWRPAIEDEERLVALETGIFGGRVPLPQQKSELGFTGFPRCIALREKESIQIGILRSGIHKPKVHCTLYTIHLLPRINLRKYQKCG